MRSTLSGVFTVEQAGRGQKVYGERCRQCHTSQAQSVAFRMKWHGRPLVHLHEFISDKMPGDEPGGLAADEYTAVLAYLLQASGMPAGEAELPGDPDALRMIRFDMLPTMNAAP
jgi:mono/diheme cytochrome c family protein